MAPFIVQSNIDGSGGVWFNPISPSFNNNLDGSNPLFGFVCARGNGCPGFSVSSITDTQANAWTNISVDTSLGVYGLGYTDTSLSGADTISFIGTGFCGFTFDPCTIIAEIGGSSSFGSLTTFNGVSSVMSGSITLGSTVYTFTTTTAYSAWVLSMVVYNGIVSGTYIVLAVPYCPNDSIGVDTIPGWQVQGANLHSALYTVTVNPAPPAPVRVFVNACPTRPISSVQ